MSAAMIWVRRAAALLAVGVAFLLPYGVSTYSVSIASIACIAALLAVSVNFLAGEMGLVSLGHAGIAASSSYAVAWSATHGHGYLAQLTIAAAVTVVVSAVYAVMALRATGVFFLMVTLSLAMIVYGLAYRLSPLTGGQNGLTGISRPPWFQQTWQFYYLCGGALIIGMVAVAVVHRSPFGLVLRGIRGSESRMRSIGYSIMPYKFVAILMSGTLAGVVGVLSVWQTEFVSPASANFQRSALLVVMVVVGGVGTTLGPVVGAGLVVWAQNVGSTYFERWPSALGLILIVVVLKAPGGLVGAGQDLIRYAARSWSARRAGKPDARSVPHAASAALISSENPTGKGARNEG